MKIRLATAEDVDMLVGLNADVQKLHADAMPHLFKQPSDLGSLAADFRDRILADADGSTFIVEDEDQAMGYIYIRIVRRPENAYTYAQNLIYIDQISVTPASQGKGCGRALMAAVFDLARSQGIDRVVLDTWAFNTPAHGFFERMGFKPFNYRMDVYLSGQQ